MQSIWKKEYGIDQTDQLIFFMDNHKWKLCNFAEQETKCLNNSMFKSKDFLILNAKNVVIYDDDKMENKWTVINQTEYNYSTFERL